MTHQPTSHSTTLPPLATAAVPAALLLQWKRQPLPPPQAVQVLDFRAGETALLEVESGRVWVTCDGLLEDYFLEAGQRLSFAGPARLRVSAEGQRPARLMWATHRPGQGAATAAAARTPAAVVTAPRGAVSAAWAGS